MGENFKFFNIVKQFLNEWLRKARHNMKKEVYGGNFEVIQYY